jgi:hypothetical protein
MRIRLLLLAALVVCACDDVTPASFHCMTDAECARGATAGLCVDSDGVCALADATCDTGYRYAGSAGSDRAGLCVFFAAPDDAACDDDAGTDDAGTDDAGTDDAGDTD